jgi:NitT/TauT family transport system permease protein/taurine transport system permease protein
MSGDGAGIPMRRLRRLTLMAALFLAWQAASTYLLPAIAPYAVTLLPAPTSVVVAFLDLARSGEIVSHIFASLGRVLVAFAVAAAAGVSLGVAMAWWRPVGRMADPIVEFLRPIPPMAWIPLGIVWFGIGNTQNIFIIFIGSIFPIALNTVIGVRRVDRTLIWGALTLGGSRRQILRHIVLPGALPAILTGLRIGLGVGWMTLVASELVAATSGLGFLIEDSRNLLFTERVLLGMVLIGLLGLLMDQVMRALQRTLTPWWAPSR